MNRSLLLAAVAALLLPLAVRSDLVLTVLVFSFLLGMLAVSFNLIFGFTGQLSLFHAAAFGIGAYATHIFTSRAGISWWAGLLLAAALVAAISAVVGVICFRFRLREFYFAVVTLAFSEIARLVVLNWTSVTNGSLGIVLADKPTLALAGFSLKLDGTVRWYYASLAALVATLVVCARVLGSWMGRCFAAIRLNDELGQALGIAVFRYKLVAFVLGSTLGAAAGGLYGAYLGFLEPAYLGVEQSLAIVAAVLLGGRRTVTAPVVGALVLTALPHVIHLSAEVRAMVYGSILILAILLLPEGISGSVGALLEKRRRGGPVGALLEKRHHAA